MEKNPTELSGFGRCRYTLGHGQTGNFGHVELYVTPLENSNERTVTWKVANGTNPSEARTEVEQAILGYLEQRMAVRPGHGYQVVVTEVTSDPVRRNDYTRAAQIAVRRALESLGLPVPQIFGE